MRGFGMLMSLTVVWLYAIGAVTPPFMDGPAGAAWADDGGDGGDDGGGDGSDGADDGADDNDDGDDNSGRSRSGAGAGDGVGTGDIIRGLGRLFQGQPVQQRRAQRSPQSAPQPVPRPTQAPDEIVTRGLTDAQTAALVAQGYVVLERADLAGLNTTIRRLQVPPGIEVQEARDAIRALPNGQTADFNHYYRTGQDSAVISDAPDIPPDCDGLHCPALELVNWPRTPGPAGCGGPVILGMVDTGLNVDHEVLAGANVEVIRVAPDDYSPSAAIHGTAVAAILVGGPETRVPGLLSGVPLIAVDAFHKQAGDERADAFTLVQALDQLSVRGVQVINLSLAGPPNSLLEDTLSQLTRQRGIPIVAAAGNGGPRAQPAFPAAYDTVIAVTAVDRNGTAYRRAGRGPHVDLAAQGVDIWTAASVKGARWKTGTSFAAPYVTAAVALWLQHDPTLSPEAIRARLTSTANDLGPDGSDEIYGHGLLDLGGVCPGQAVPWPAATE